MLKNRDSLRPHTPGAVDTEALRCFAGGLRASTLFIRRYADPYFRPQSCPYASASKLQSLTCASVATLRNKLNLGHPVGIFMHHGVASSVANCIISVYQGVLKMHSPTVRLTDAQRQLLALVLEGGLEHELAVEALVQLLRILSRKKAFS